MKEAYVSYEVAKLLKEKGFDWGCRAFMFEDDSEIKLGVNSHTYEDFETKHFKHLILLPTQQMAMRWLREEHGIMITPDRDKIVNVAPEPFYDYWCTIRHNGNEHWVSSLDLPDTQHYTEYEDVVEAALQYCLTNLI